MNKRIEGFWSFDANGVMDELNTSQAGLTQNEVEKRRLIYGDNKLVSKEKASPFKLFLKQLSSPITLILLFAVVISVILKDYTDSIIILLIVLASAALGFFQEYNAGNAVSKLLEVVSIKANVRRDGTVAQIPLAHIVPGDVVELSAGDVIPADGLLIEENALSIDESSMTGETFPVEKKIGILDKNSNLSQRSNCLWMGTHVISGTGTFVVADTGANTEFGNISSHLQQREPETDFEKGVRQFGNLLMKVTATLLMVIFLVNIVLKKPVFDSFLFSMSLAVGLTPQLLPAIISVNLSSGSKRMAEKKVIVKKLESIENFGSMDVLCTDKTGTITVGVVQLDATLNVEGEHSERVGALSLLNASLQSGYGNAIDEAIKTALPLDLSGYQKLREIPYNFVDKRMGVILKTPEDSPLKDKDLLVVKGAFSNVLEVCSFYEDPQGKILPLEGMEDGLKERFQNLSASGYRTLGVAYKSTTGIDPDEVEEKDMIFAGMITFLDPLKPHIGETVKELAQLGVQLKVITGDNRYVAANIAKELELSTDEVLTGDELTKMNEMALQRKMADIAVFAEIDPNQKERIILSLLKAGKVVGYMGDGINDASAIHAADVGVSVIDAADVAKEAANIVLLEQDLEVLIDGIRAGRSTFANTMKYVFMATSANFGNMFSMAGASLFLPFLPLMPTQILLANLLTDLPEMQIAKDNVDPEMLERPHRWNIDFIKKFMMTFGLLSSVFDYLTFGLLIFVFKANEALFQTGWFTESILSAGMIVFVMRTQKTLHQSKPSKGMVVATVMVVIITLALPYTPIGSLLHFTPLPVTMIGAIFALVALYILSGEVLKKIFYRHLQP